MPGMAGIAGIKDVKGWLSTAAPTGWDAANTDGITPKIELKQNVTESMLNTGDFVIINFVNEFPGAFGIHADDWRHDVPLSIQVRTKKRVAGAEYLDHLEKMVNEVARIIKARARQAGYAMNYLTSANNLSGDPHGPFIMDLGMTLVKINP